MDAPIAGSCCQRRHFLVLRTDCPANLLQRFRLAMVALSAVIIRFHQIWKKGFRIGRSLQFLRQNSINSNQFRIVFHIQINQTTAPGRILNFDHC